MENVSASSSCCLVADQQRAQYSQCACERQCIEYLKLLCVPTTLFIRTVQTTCGQYGASFLRHRAADECAIVGTVFSLQDSRAATGKRSKLGSLSCSLQAAAVTEPAPGCAANTRPTAGTIWTKQESGQRHWPSQASHLHDRRNPEMEWFGLSKPQRILQVVQIVLISALSEQVLAEPLPDEESFQATSNSGIGT